MSILSVKTGNLVKRVSLNELVTTSKKGIDKVLFCGVVVWKDKIVGFYTYKDPRGTEFIADAIILNQEGGLEKSGQEIGLFTHVIRFENIPGQAPGGTGGRNTLSVVNDFKFCFTPDSSHLLVQSAPEDGKSNVRFKIYKPGMLLEKDVSIVLPIKDNKETIRHFAMSNNGIIYLITRGDKFTLYSINSSVQSNPVAYRSFTSIDRTLVTASLGFTKNGTPIVTGAYRIDSKKPGMHGAYAFKVDFSTQQFLVNTRDVPDSVIVTYMGKKSLRKGEGLMEFIGFGRLVPKREGGLYAFGQSNSVRMIARGSTGALNSYYHETWLNAAYSISEEGKILWESIAGIQIANTEFATRHSRIEYAPVGEEVHGLTILYKPDGIHDYHGSAKGTRVPVTKISKELINFPFVEGTIRQIGDREFVVIGFNDGRSSKIRLIKIKV